MAINLYFLKKYFIICRLIKTDSLIRFVDSVGNELQKGNEYGKDLYVSQVL